MLKKDLLISQLQKHIKDVDHRPDKKYEVVLKLFEEVGELSVEMRKESETGLSLERKQAIKYELYDVLHYVNHIANIYDINLEEAIIEKDHINEGRYNDRRKNHD